MPGNNWKLRTGTSCPAEKRFREWSRRPRFVRRQPAHLRARRPRFALSVQKAISTYAPARRRSERLGRLAMALAWPQREEREPALGALVTTTRGCRTDRVLALAVAVRREPDGAARDVAHSASKERLAHARSDERDGK